MHLIFKPYKNNVYNMWDTFCYFLYAMDRLSTWCKDHDPSVSLDLLYLSNAILFLYLCSIAIVKTAQVITPGLYVSCLEKAKDLYKHFTLRNLICSFRKKNMMIDPERASIEDLRQSHDDDSPVRLINPQDYQPLLAKSGRSEFQGLLYYGTSN